MVAQTRSSSRAHGTCWETIPPELIVTSLKYAVTRRCQYPVVAPSRQLLYGIQLDADSSQLKGYGYVPQSTETEDRLLEQFKNAEGNWNPEIEAAYDRCRVLVKRLKALEPAIQELHTVDVDGNECTVSSDGEWSIAPTHPMTHSELSAVVDRAKATPLSKAKARRISTAQSDFKAQKAAFDNASSRDMYTVQAPWCAFLACKAWHSAVEHVAPHLLAYSLVFIRGNLKTLALAPEAARSCLEQIPLQLWPVTAYADASCVSLKSRDASLTQACRLLPRLRYLDLTSQHLTKGALRCLCKHCPVLESLVLKYTTLAEDLTDPKSLVREIDGVSTMLPPSWWFGNALTGTPQLGYINMDRACWFDDLALSAIAHLCPKVTEISLDRCDVSSEGCRRLHALIPDCKLERLSPYVGYHCASSTDLNYSDY